MKVTEFSRVAKKVVVFKLFSLTVSNSLDLISGCVIYLYWCLVNTPSDVTELRRRLKERDDVTDGTVQSNDGQPSGEKTPFKATSYSITFGPRVFEDKQQNDALF